MDWRQLGLLDEQITVEMADIQDGLATLQRLLRQRRRMAGQLARARTHPQTQKG